MSAVTFSSNQVPLLDSTNKDDLLQKISITLGKGSSVANISVKREVYQAAYEILRKADTSNSVLRVKLFELFEQYASETCYAQGADGFQKCACLLEAALLLQLDSLNLHSYVSAWKEFDKIEDFINSLKSQNNLDELTGNLFTTDADVLVQMASKEGIRPLMAKSMVKLSFAYQNIAAICNRGFEFHQRINEITEKLIGSETIEEKRELEMYRYNRCSFLADLKSPGDTSAKLDSYDSVIALLKECYDKSDPRRLSREAQIANIKGLILLKTGKAAMRQAALPFFKAAFEIRSELIKQYAEDSKEHYEQEYLLSNVRTALVDYIVNSESPTDEELQELQDHKKALEAYLKKMEAKDDTHTYGAFYRGALDKIAAFSSK